MGRNKIYRTIVVFLIKLLRRNNTIICQNICSSVIFCMLYLKFAFIKYKSLHCKNLKKLVLFPISAKYENTENDEACFVT